MQYIASELKEVLTALKPILGGSGDNKCSEFSFDGKYAYAFNGMTFVSVPCESEFQGSVDGKKLLALVTRFGNATVDITGVKGNVVIKKGRSKAELPFDDAIEHPINFAGIEGWKDVPSGFMDAIHLCELTTGSTDSDFTSVIHVDGSFIESTDRMRLTVVELEESVDEDFYVPVHVIRFFKKRIIKQYYHSASWLAFQMEDGVIICTRSAIVEKYPNLGANLENFEATAELELPGNLYDSLDKADVLATHHDDAKNNVCISTKGGQLKVKLISEGKYTDTIGCDFMGEIRFYVRPKFLMETIERSTAVSVSDGAIVFRHGNATSLVMLAGMGGGEDE